MGLSIGQGIGIPFKKSSQNWSIYWNARKPSNLVVTTHLVGAILELTENGDDYDGLSWEKSTDNGVSFAEFKTTNAGTPIVLDYYSTFTQKIIYRARAYKGTNYSPYTDEVVASPNVLIVNSQDSSVELSDNDSDYYFNDSGNDKAFSVLAIVKSNNTSAINTLLSRGDVNGTSYNIRVNTLGGKIDFVIYGSDLTNNNCLYAITTNSTNTNINKLAFTYSGSKLATGMNIYKNATLQAYSLRTKYGTYTAMNNRPGLYVGRMIKDSEQGNFNIYGLIICNKELSQEEVTEFQEMLSMEDVTGLSFYDNIISCQKFDGTLMDSKNDHNGTSVSPAYTFSDSLPPHPTVLPSLSETTFQGLFKDFKLGWFLCYGMPTYNGDETNGKTVVTSAPSIFAAPATVDVATWAGIAAASGKIDYAILTVSHIYGFSLYDHKTAIWRGTQTDTDTGYTIPDYLKYDVGADGCTADKNIVTKFITEFNAVGIKPILYLNPAWARNWFGDKSPYLTFTDQDYQFLAAHKLMIDRLRELASLNPFAIWLDSENSYPVGYTWDFYSAIKGVNSGIGVILNLSGNKVRVDNTYGAMDVGSVEEDYRPATTTDDFWTQIQVISSVSYPNMRELTLPSRESSKWFYKTSPASLRLLADLQEEYDFAKTVGIPCAISMNPKLDGTLDTDQSDLIADIVL
ncbi:MAG: hypothetical protein ABFD04_00315 [Syntrophomonas sp.]